MRKFEFGLFALCMLAGGYLGSLFGMAVAVCAFMTVAGLVEITTKHLRKKYDEKQREETKLC